MLQGCDNLHCGSIQLHVPCHPLVWVFIVPDNVWCTERVSQYSERVLAPAPHAAV